MAEFLTTHATSYHIENIIKNTKHELILVSPYLQISQIFLDRLKDAAERGVKTIIVYGKKQLQPEEESQLAKLKNLSLFFCENLHAKCYYNEDNMVITSMNMYEFSEKNNREMGVLIKREEDAAVFQEALREVQSILKASVADKPTLKSILGTLSTILTGEKADAAYCIRRGDRIPFDPNRPLCDDCYRKWAEHKNPDYPEHYCHSCGKQSKTTYEKPLCRSCYAKAR